MRTLEITSRPFHRFHLIEDQRGDGVCMLSLAKFLAEKDTEPRRRLTSPFTSSLFLGPWGFKLVSDSSLYFQVFLFPFPFIFVPSSFHLIFILFFLIIFDNSISWTASSNSADGQRKLSPKSYLF